MKLLTKAITKKLIANRGKDDAYPVLKLFTPAANATWLITDMEEDGLLFGLCDLGLGCPELGYVSLDELSTVWVERDLYFKADKPLSAYADEARKTGRLVA
jgi:Protein of unknown function (DUF2958)